MRRSRCQLSRCMGRMRDRDCPSFQGMVFIGLILLRRRCSARSVIQMPCPARSWVDRLGGFQPGGQLLAGVADHVVDGPALLAAVLGGPPAKAPPAGGGPPAGGAAA